jgi:hypothetical protein
MPRLKKLMKQLLARCGREYLPPHKSPITYAGLTPKEEAIAWLEKAAAERDPDMTNRSKRHSFFASAELPVPASPSAGWGSLGM